MSITTGARQLLGLWGSILSAGAQRLTTAALWSAVKEAATANGQVLQGVTIQDMNFVRSAANRVVNAQRAVAAADPAWAIDRTMIAQSPWSTPTVASQAAPEWMVRYEAQFQTEEGPVTQWMSTSYDLTSMLPQTVGDLTSDLADDANSNVSTSSPPCGGQLVGVGSIQIMSM